MSDEVKVGDIVDASSFIDRGGQVRAKVIAVEVVNGRTCVTVPYLNGTLRTTSFTKVQPFLVRTKKGERRWVMPKPDKNPFERLR